MTQEPEETTGQPAEEEVVDAEVVSAADPADAPDAEDNPGGDAGPETGQEAGDTVEGDLAALVEEARNQRDEYLQLAQRTKADFDNYRKRMAAESKAQMEKGRLEVATGLIEAIDNLERVLDAAGISRSAALDEQLPAEAPIAEQGVIVAYRDLHGVLRKSGIESFESKGEQFDPNLHEALQAIAAEGAESGTVIEEMQKGYRAGETVIRHARVVVSQ